MKEISTSEDDQLVEALNVKENITVGFSKNVIHPFLKSKEYFPVNKGKKFISSNISNVDFINRRNIVISALLSFTFYFLLIIICIEPDTVSIILFVFITLIAIFLYRKLYRNIQPFYPKVNLKQNLKKLLMLMQQLLYGQIKINCNLLLIAQM